jgi:probable selenium-dependent hydroxylase accessory protein YqeC
MKLAQALGVGQGEVVAFVGAGGKTTAIFTLARELAAQGKKTLVTTTTHIWRPPLRESPSLLLEAHLDRMLEAVREALSKFAIVTAAYSEEAGKLQGIDPLWVAALLEVEGVDNILVEADGAAGRSLKAPLPHEPVIPRSATVVVPVVGVDALGKPLTEEWVHRPRQVAELTGLESGAALTSRAVADVLLHPEGSTRGAPPQARRIPLINKADGPSELSLAQELARELLGRGVERVVISCLASETPQVEVVFAASLQAAGGP